MWKLGTGTASEISETSDYHRLAIRPDIHMVSEGWWPNLLTLFVD